MGWFFRSQEERIRDSILDLVLPLLETDIEIVYTLSPDKDEAARILEGNSFGFYFTRTEKDFFTLYKLGKLLVRHHLVEEVCTIYVKDLNKRQKTRYKEALKNAALLRLSNRVIKAFEAEKHSRK